MRTTVVLVAAAALLAGCGDASTTKSAVPQTSPSGSERPTATAPTQERVIREGKITESSGLAVSLRDEQVLWTINDSGGEAALYGIDATGRTQAVITLPGAPARDYEALAAARSPSGGAFLWVGDIGDNQSSWDSVRVLKVAEPARIADGSARFERFDLRFPDGPRDAETLMVSPAGRVYVVSKKVVGGAVYVAPTKLSANSTNTLKRLRDAPALVTDGAFSPDGSRYVLRNYTQAYVYDTESGEQQLVVDMPKQPQGESIAWTPDGTALLAGSEGAGSVVWKVPLPSA